MAKAGKAKKMNGTDVLDIKTAVKEGILGRPGQMVVDYGSGLAYVSYEIAKANKDARIFLADIDCLVQEFAVFRIKKLGVDVQPIHVTKTKLYIQ